MYRQTAEFGFQSLGHYSGTSTTDLVAQGWGTSYYQMVPYDCGSNVGTAKDSETFTPDVFDNTSTEWGVLSGSWTTVTSSKFYNGSALETLSAGASVDYNNTGAFNDGVVIATGPSGGIATAYVNGVKQPGTINCWSRRKPVTSRSPSSLGSRAAASTRSTLSRPRRARAAATTCGSTLTSRSTADLRAI